MNYSVEISEEKVAAIIQSAVEGAFREYDSPVRRAIVELAKASVLRLDLRSEIDGAIKRMLPQVLDDVVVELLRAEVKRKGKAMLSGLLELLERAP